MSYKIELSDLERDGATSITEQIVARFRAAIDEGDLSPGEKLPTTRALAEAAGVNHLTAVRAYRRLAQDGYVTAARGRGTFVRRVPPAAAGGVEWQSAVLPEARPSYANEIMAESFRMPADPGIVSLATGWPDPALYPVGELAAHTSAVFEEMGGDALSYVDPEGVPALRAELAARGRTAGFASSAEEIIVTSGARQGLDLVCRAVLSAGDVVAVESPTFTGLLSSLQATGARVIGIPVDDDGADVEALEGILARHELKLVALQSACQNPTGRDLSPARRERLVELARERSFFVLEDGVYATVRFDTPQPSRLRASAPGHVIYVDSLSKTIGGGLRVGWLAASGPVRQRLVGLKLASDVHTSSLVQHVAARYLAAGAHDRHLAATNPIYQERCDALRESLVRRLGDEVVASRPLGGHHLWARLSSAMDERALFTEALRQGVGFTPGAATMAEASEHAALRLSFSLLGTDALDEGVRRLGVALRAVRRQQRGPSVSLS